MRFLRTHRLEIVLFAFALLVRVLALGADISGTHATLLQTVRGDDGYYQLSNNLLAGHGFSMDPGPPYVPTALRTPGYIYFLVAILWASGSYLVLTIIQLLLGALVPVLARRVALEFKASGPIALAVGIFLALEPTFVIFSYDFGVETLFLVLFFPFLILFMRYLRKPQTGTLAASALLLGFATIVKPTSEYLPILVLPFVWYAARRGGTKRIAHQILLFLLIPFAILAPWMWRNYEVFGVPAVTSQEPYALYAYLAPSAIALQSGEDFNTEFSSFTTDAERGGDTITLTNGAAYKAKALAVIEAHPEGLVLSGLMTVAGFFTQDGVLPFLQHAGIGVGAKLSRPALELLFSDPFALAKEIGEVAASPLILVLVYRLALVLITLFFLAGAWLRLRRDARDPSLWLALILVTYLVLTSVPGGLGVNSRYRMPVEPFMLVLAFEAFRAMTTRFFPRGGGMSLSRRAATGTTSRS